MDINTTTLVGRLTRDVELSYTKSKMAIGKFSIAVNGKKDDDVSFVNITVWDKTAAICSQYLHKGSRVVINGRLDQSRWKTEDGQNRSTLGVTANTVQFLDPASTNQQSQTKTPDFTDQEPAGNDFIPF